MRSSPRARGVRHAKKGSWEGLTGRPASRHTRDEIIDFIAYWSKRTGPPLYKIRTWTGLPESKYYDWKRRYGEKNRHNGQMPKKHWITDSERKAIIGFCQDVNLEGYRRLPHMLLDMGVVAVSPSTVYRVLKQVDMLSRAGGRPSKKGDGFDQRRVRTSTGAGTSPILTSRERSTTSVPCWTVTTAR